ncbi:protein-glutamine gamma-glutamyltransferase 5 [Melanotaenia boesemani]|uniref:protein-glutamine gamma-glutamyltransferase 5 n=1 Tax=Melanotaenia boesemani TaxID=1250792 RepID=UPI001C04A715|nr:protein-glutamine gamma-glutamyltransferase 5 [Melanotaenia boesemani]
MAARFKQSVFAEVDVHSKTNNTEHHTHEISLEQLIVRRGQSFNLTLKLSQSFTPDLHPFIFTAVTGEYPSEDLGTKSRFGIPDTVQRSPSAKAVWRAELQGGSSPQTGTLNLNITPSASTPLGAYKLSVQHRGEEKMLTNLVVLFNPWCPDDWVFLSDEAQKQEYVMNEQGVIYRGSDNYIYPMHWDYGQFEEDTVKICLKILDLNKKHLRNPADDVSARSNPIYVGRVVSAMINSQDDNGVVQGNWGKEFGDGVPPTHWSGSYAILKRWIDSNCLPVKYGQCWVFAGVMCSVMRLLGIPCRVVSNFQSAHDTNKNLTVDNYYADYGVREKESRDSVWNFHVWVEGWMKRPDLAKDGRYDGWQVLDPTPQEMSDGMYCCGPAPVSAILNGDTHLKYDVPFVFAEVNADCSYWLVKADGSEVKIFSDTKTVGQNISTKSVGSNKRMDITDTYKHREGTEKERAVFKFALAHLENSWIEINGANANNGNTEEATSIPPPQLVMQFAEVSIPRNGEDVRMKLVLNSDSSVPRTLSVNISVQAMQHNGSPAGNIQTEVTEQTLLPGKDLSIPIVVPFSAYGKYMVENKSINISAMVTDKQKPDNIYLAENRVVLKDPPVSITVFGQSRVNQETSVEWVFMNPLKETLKDCSLTISGSGLLQGETVNKLPDLRPNCRVRTKFPIVPYKSGQRTLIVDFDCSAFRNVKDSRTILVLP